MHDTLNEFDLLARDLADKRREAEIKRELLDEAEAEASDIERRLVELTRGRTTLPALQVLSLGRLVEIDLAGNTARIVPVRTSKGILNGGLDHA